MSRDFTFVAPLYEGDQSRSNMFLFFVRYGTPGTQITIELPSALNTDSFIAAKLAEATTTNRTVPILTRVNKIKEICDYIDAKKKAGTYKTIDVPAQSVD